MMISSSVLLFGLLGGLSSISSNIVGVYGVIQNEWESIGIISDLNIDDIVTIRGYRGTFLRATTTSNKVESYNRYEDNKSLWKVGSYTNNNGITGYSFYNLEIGCYLISLDGYLKCQDVNQNDNISWNNDDTTVINYFYGNARWFSRLKNNDDNKCMHIEKDCNGDDDGIKMKTEHCNDGDQELVYFERVNPLSLTNPSTSNNLDEQWNSFSNLEGTSNDLLSIDDQIYIRSFYNGLFLTSSGDGNVMTLESEIDNLHTLWTVKDVNRVVIPFPGTSIKIKYNEYQFYNDYDNCYIIHNNGKMKCRSDPGTSSWWTYYNLNSEIVYNDDNSDYQRAYMPLMNSDKSKCIKLGSGSRCGADIKLETSTCDDEIALVYFERAPSSSS